MDLDRENSLSHWTILLPQDGRPGQAEAGGASAPPPTIPREVEGLVHCQYGTHVCSKSLANIQSNIHSQIREG